MLEKNKISQRQMEFIENKDVFSRVITTISSTGKNSLNCHGVLFSSNNVKLIAKDAGNILGFLGVEDSESKMLENGNQYFMPTSFDELILGFKYTDSKGLEEFFRRGGENNSNLNAVICCFLQNNIDESQIDVKELIQSTKQIKQVIDDKAKDFYDKKEDVYAKKIAKYQAKMESVRLERNGLQPNGEPFENMEAPIDEVLENLTTSLIVETSLSPAEPILKIEDVLSLLGDNKDYSETELNTEVVQDQIEQ